MRYLKVTKAEVLREKYKYIIGWGAGGEYKKYCLNPTFLDYLVDTGKKGAGQIGAIVNGVKVSDTDEIKGLAQYWDNCLIVIYPNIEQEILSSVYQVFPNDVDTIVGRLVDFNNENRSYATSFEDCIMLGIMQKLNMDNFSYMDIGVCHPVVRNNTYLFYERGNKNGVLVEPNVEMCNLAKCYRPNDQLANCGASADHEDKELTYYFDNNNPGLNTFSREVAEQRGMSENTISIPVKNINKIIADNFTDYPNVLDIDTEGMDYEILCAIDFEKYPIDVICAETNGNESFVKLMDTKGYKQYARTKENTIFIKKNIDI